MRYFLSSLLLVFLLTGCQHTKTTNVPRYLEYSELDHRTFTRVGLDILTARGELVTVESNQKDTLVWVERDQKGAFQFAFLRRGNAVYILGKDGPFLMGNSVQTASYDILMQAWRKAQEHENEAVAVWMPEKMDPLSMDQ